jgi:hypothetical protein
MNPEIDPLTAGPMGKRPLRRAIRRDQPSRRWPWSRPLEDAPGDRVGQRPRQAARRAGVARWDSERDQYLITLLPPPRSRL